jgi:hypothetical protein
VTHNEAHALGLRLLAACAALGIDPYRIGMPVRHGHADGLAVVVSPAERILGIHAVAGAWSGHTGSQHCWPDLREGAGRGIALELVREVVGCDHAYTVPWPTRPRTHESIQGWHICYPTAGGLRCGRRVSTEVEMMVCELEEAAAAKGGNR